MGDMLSQAEIDALLRGRFADGVSNGSNSGNEQLSPEEIDALGEIGNISMGTAATTLYTLLGHKVTITTPQVSVTTWDKLKDEHKLPYVAVKVEYIRGLSGSNLMIIQEEDVRIITDLMMGGDGNVGEGPVDDFHLSAIGEAMNQMIGSSSTSMSSMFNKRIDISPPKAFSMTFNSEVPKEIFNDSETIVKVAFKMVVGDLIDSTIMQLLPIDFARELVKNLLNIGTQAGEADIKTEQTSDREENATKHSSVQDRGHQQQDNGFSGNGMNDGQYGYREQPSEDKKRREENIKVQPVHFQDFEDETITLEKKNINLIMDVPLEVTVELGRTNKVIKDILELSAGSIIELDKLAGDPVDILVNGKPIAKGEVVVIDESFGVRIIDIAQPSKRF
jgi:flagellar motor switch protein FliN/FliY